MFDYEKAIAEAERAVTLKPSSTDALTQLEVNSVQVSTETEVVVPIRFPSRNSLYRLVDLPGDVDGDEPILFTLKIVIIEGRAFND